DRSPVTVADFAVQAVIARRLAERVPRATLIGEENADALRLEEGVAILDQITEFVRQSSPDATPEEVCTLIDRGAGEPPDTYWTLDPIDGTKGFLRREQYAVALALVRNGKVELGVLGCPELAQKSLRIASQLSAETDGCVCIAARNQGAWCQPLNSKSGWQKLSASPRTQSSTARILRSV